jgi:hypothetical protein
MTILDTHGSRRAVFWAALVFAVILGVFFARQMASARAAKQAVIMEDARIALQHYADAGLTTRATPVLIELFTSEGCSSCPPADALLARLRVQQPVVNADIIALEEHVDYWDELGWHDRFSAHQFTERQNEYEHGFHLDESYTPQMVVDGTKQFVGNDMAQALLSIGHAAEKPKIALTLEPPVMNGASIYGSVSVPTGTSLPKADLYAALIEPMASTQVRAGENGGRTLHHVSVVRRLERIGYLNSLSRKPLPFSLDLPKDEAEGLQVVVFAQRDGQGEVLAVATSASARPAMPSVPRQVSMR